MLVGMSSQGVLSEIEAGIKRPGMGMAIGCELLFGVPIRELFPDLFAEIEREVLAQARRLHARLEAMGARRATRLYLAALISRLGGATTQP